METAEALKAAEETVHAALAEIGVDPDAIRNDAKLAELYIDSLDLIELVHIVEEEYRIGLMSKDLEQVVTVGDAVDLIGNRAGR